MRSGGRVFKDGQYWFYFRCHGLVWKYTAQERLALEERDFPVCPQCGSSQDRLGREISPKNKKK